MADPTGRRSITAVIPVRDASAFLPDTVPAVLRAAQEHGETAIVYVDNGSIDGSRELLISNWGPAITLLSLPEGTISAVRNRGANGATTEFISFIDADCLAPPTLFTDIERTFGEVNADAVGSRYALPDNPDPLERAWHDLHRLPGAGWVHHLPGGNLAVRTAAFRAIGGFDERLTTGEDADLCRRLIRSGCRIFETDRVAVQHLGNPKTLRAFYRKQVWHSLGGPRALAADRPTMLALAHLSLLLTALAAIVMPIGPAASRTLLAGVVTWIAPAAAVMFRLRSGGRAPRPALALILYQLYLLARIRGFMHRTRASLGRRQAARVDELRA